MLVWDEAKRKTNLQKHGLDFADAGLVYDNPDKITFQSPRKGEARKQDIAMVAVNGPRISFTQRWTWQRVRLSFKERRMKLREPMKPQRKSGRQGSNTYLCGARSGRTGDLISGRIKSGERSL
jgi:uncharacterized DUF497 family protein